MQTRSGVCVLGAVEAAGAECDARLRSTSCIHPVMAWQRPAAAGARQQWMARQWAGAHKVVGVAAVGKEAHGPHEPPRVGCSSSGRAQKGKRFGKLAGAASWVTAQAGEQGKKTSLTGFLHLAVWLPGSLMAERLV